METIQGPGISDGQAYLAVKSVIYRNDNPVSYADKKPLEGSYTETI
jgi:hypothetical protein